jgi:hypothetical protein
MNELVNWTTALASAGEERIAPQQQRHRAATTPAAMLVPEN